MTHFCWETIWNVLSRLMSFTIVKFFYILFTTVKAFYQRQIPSVTTATTTSWFAIALDEIRTRRILREKADCKQSTTILMHDSSKIRRDFTFHAIYVNTALQANKTKKRSLRLSYHLECSWSLIVDRSDCIISYFRW